MILISDMLDDEKRVINALQNLRSMGNDVITFQIMDNAELNFPFTEASEFIDLENKPDWFLKISPTGKVPLLKVDGEVIFESAVINEYLDEVTEGSLLPSDPLLKAKSRAWIEFSNSILMSSYGLFAATDEDLFSSKKEAILKQLGKLEKQLPGGGFFNGNSFSLVDAALAPAFTRILLVEKRFGNFLTKEFPKISELAANLEKQDYVKNSLIPGFGDKFLNYLEKKESFLYQL